MLKAAAREPRPTSMSRGASLTPRETILAIVSAIASITIVGMGLSLTMPLLALRLEAQGYSARAIGLNSTAGGLAVLGGAFFVPALARRIGVKRLLLLALLIGILSLLSFALTNEYWIWLFIRGVFGGALTALFVVSEYSINALAPPRQRGFVLGFYATSLAAGFAVGPLILGFTGTAGTGAFHGGNGALRARRRAHRPLERPCARAQKRSGSRVTFIPYQRSRGRLRRIGAWRGRDRELRPVAGLCPSRRT